MCKETKVAAIIVAAGKGTRMNSDCPKQFIKVNGHPILYYTIKVFEKSNVDEIIIVTSKEYMDYVNCEIVDKYGFKKVSKVIEGGKERYESVYCGLKSMQNVGYVLVHDAARPFITADKINEVIEATYSFRAVVLGVKSKDTVKIVSEDGYVKATPDRNTVWNVQTPQAFEYKLLKSAYDKVIELGYSNATDDAMIIEYATEQPVKMLEGSYRNIKITTPEDLDERLF